MEKATKIILGIDPGTLVMGYGLLHVEGKNLSLADMGVLSLTKIKDTYQRLQLIHEKVKEVITKYSPTSFAIEAPFFGKNVQSMLKLGRAQGVAIATAMQAGLEVTEYSPKKVKQVVTGNGNASKEQIWKMLQQQLQLPNKPKFYDATDALAVALCHYYQSQSPITNTPKSVSANKKKRNSWEDFIAQNPEKVVTRQL